MKYDKAYNIVCDRSVLYLKELREEEMDKASASFLVGAAFIFAGVASGVLTYQLFEIFNFTLEHWIDETIAQSIVFISLLFPAAYLALWVTAMPKANALRKRLELIDKVEKNVLRRAIDEANDEAK